MIQKIKYPVRSNPVSTGSKTVLQYYAVPFFGMQEKRWKRWNIRVIVKLMIQFRQGI